MPRTIVKEVENARLYDDGTILVRNVRFSYPHVDEPWAKKPEEKKKFSVVGLLPKSTHRAAKDLIKGEMDRILTENKQNPKVFKKDAKFLRDGNDAGKEEYVDHYTVNASEDRRPQVRGPDNKKITDPAKIREAVQPGFWGDILIRPWWQNNDWGKRVNAGLTALQVKRRDETFGEGGISDEDLDETFEAADEEDQDYGGFDADDDDEL